MTNLSRHANFVQIRNPDTGVFSYVNLDYVRTIKDSIRGEAGGCLLFTNEGHAWTHDKSAVNLLAQQRY